VLGEHGLFEHALVNVGILALQKGTPTSAPQTPLHVAWSSPQSGAASRVIRAIRRSIFESKESEPTAAFDGWSVTTTSLDALHRRPSWLPGAGALGMLLDTVQANTGTRISDLFEVKQGIRTGANPLFIQPAEVVMSLPPRERQYFRKAIDSSSFVNGELRPQKYLFLAPNNTWKSEQELIEALPEFFNNYIRTHRELLDKRTSLRGRPYWELAEPRTSWMFKGSPRLLSKRFGLFPAFGRDFDLSFAVVQANAWIPRDSLTRNHETDELCEILTSYWWLLNSRVVVALFREYCPNVAGGQLDLENKYVKHVPLPNLPRQFREVPALAMLANTIRSRYPNTLPSVRDCDDFAATAFGTDISEWNLSGLEQPD
jgi:adenine-specific DNA-methyltransferase